MILIRYFFFFVIIISCGPWYVHAVFAEEISPKFYELQLQYDPTKQHILVDGETPYRVISGTAPLLGPPRFSEYFGSVYSGAGKTLLEFGFSRPENVLSGKRTPFPLRVPYFFNATHIDLYQGSTILLSIDVTPSAVCRENTRCEMEYGENIQNCPADCENVSSSFIDPQQTVQTTSKDAPIMPGALPPDGKREEAVPPHTSSFPVLSVIFFVLGLGSFGVWVYLRRKP
jgi:hypothetical protein